MDENKEVGKRVAAGSAIFLSFIVAMEIVIMISPFAMFFYAVFNPFLTALNGSSLTRWLAAFFLPHMVVPPNLPLQILRIIGSVLFVGGLAIFLICAIQVYSGKLFKKRSGQVGILRHYQASPICGFGDRCAGHGHHVAAVFDFGLIRRHAFSVLSLGGLRGEPHAGAFRRQLPGISE